MPSSYANHNKPALITATPAFPQYKIKADASFGGKTIYENIQFFNFDDEYDYCGNEQRLFRLNHYSADYQPRTLLTKVRFHVSLYFNLYFIYRTLLKIPSPISSLHPMSGQSSMTAENSLAQAPTTS